MTDIRFNVRRYIDDGWAVVPLQPREKGTRDTDWLRKATDKTYALDAFDADANVGVIPGKPSGDRLDVDLDAPQAVMAGASLLPHTNLVHGRPGKPASHHWFQVSDGQARQYKDPVDKSMLLEIRYGNGLTMVPPSIHPLGERVTWEREGDPAKFEFAAIERHASYTAIAALLAKYWPGRGSRQQAALNAAGFLGRYIKDQPTLTAIFDCVLRIAGDDEPDMRRRAIRDTLVNLAADARKVTGGPTFRAEFPHGEAIAGAILGWLGVEAADAIERMNARHFVVRLGSDIVIGTEDDGVIFQPEKALKLLYRNQSIKIGKRHVRLLDHWLEHRDRRQYRTVVFAPPPVACDPRDFNLWTGFAVEPDASPEPERRCARFLDHVRDVICSGNVEHADYLLDHLAFAVQQPGVPAEVAVSMKGDRGTGKSMFARYVGSIFGRHYIQLDRSEHATGRFNAALSAKVMVFADEAFFAGDKRAEGALKRLITEPELVIERKFCDAVTERNHVHLICATNDDWAVPAGWQERRFFVLKVSDRRLGDHDYFDALDHELRHGGREALLAFLFARTVDRQALRRVPRTEELRVQQEYTASPEWRWWSEVLHDGEINWPPCRNGCIGCKDAWPERVTIDELHAAYLTWCQPLKIARPASKFHLVQSLLQPWVSDRQREPTGDRRWTWKLAPLAEARAIFDRQAGAKTAWLEAPVAEGEPRDLPF